MILLLLGLVLANFVIPVTKGAYTIELKSAHVVKYIDHHYHACTHPARVQAPYFGTLSALLETVFQIILRIFFHFIYILIKQI
jgi:hypothetical protein